MLKQTPQEDENHVGLFRILCMQTSSVRETWELYHHPGTFPLLSLSFKSCTKLFVPSFLLLFFYIEMLTAFCLFAQENVISKSMWLTP